MEASTPTLPLGTTLFMCNICDKPFTKEPQYRRHVSYCRKSQGGRTRPRSCRACHSAKIKCDYRAPCHQCVRKKVGCVYDKQVRQPEGREGAAGKGIVEEVVAAVASNAAPPDIAARIDDRSTEPGLEVETVGFGLIDDQLFGQFDGDEEFSFDPSPDFSQLPNTDGPSSMKANGRGNWVSTTTMAPPSKDVDSFMSLLHHTFNNTTDINLTNNLDLQMFDYHYTNGKELQLPIFSPEYWESPTMVNPSLSLSPNMASLTMAQSRHFSRTEVQTCLQRAHATLIIDMIRAYPRMMMRRKTFPPFVHADAPSEYGQDRLPKNLSNCMGITQLFAVCNDDTRPFLWNTIRTEMRGFRDRLSTFGKCDAFAALQACLVYLIMRAVDGVPQAVGDDWDMIVIYDVRMKSAFASAVCRHAVSFATDHNEVEKNPNILWKDWILAESCRRIACVWFILTRVFQVRTGMPCYVSDNFRWIPLPCTRAEWEARTESSWREEYQAACAVKKGVQTFGDLIDAYQNRESSKLDLWNASIDHLGMTLNLAVHII